MNTNDLFGIAMALLLTYSGMACLSLAMPRHYDQVWGRDPSAGHTRVLRGAGALLLALALLPCVGLWGNTVGVVAWLGWLSAGALLWVGMLSWAPRPAARTAALAMAISLAGIGIGF
ncbi:DUF3325 domain-containing protein [Achromobacter sp. LC458]|uniref:DUF3325 domain-containing protein n=1 Tax=Achromobacter spanius TaxID=217203 RepID=A0A2S5GKU9_9BURK|nr:MULTISPECIES: DUF3325 domain-containing protein [Achromobacter]AYD65037.1 DUF3325 domain-containing protein [Achromobacter sp. B7]MDX3984702.1 DUF3325 domain-containing protein [Achromobacter sp.]PPA73511.1 DUF3325 domain-containing protein [Achromobacter spanius]QYJ19183.1 DUF3325 domain-containing protein [Achromobacter sp. ES-001]TRM49928.1 DUF3325 domain-containing protein [Achromobacter sp. LC458]